MTAVSATAGSVSLHDRFKNAITHRYFIRVHMTILLSLVVVSGLLASKLLTLAGLTDMAVRYPLMVALSYLVFFGLVRIWIAYVLRASRSRGKGSSSADLGDLFSGSGGSGGSGGGGGGGSGGGRFFSGGGKFGSGGSSASFADEPAPRMAVVPMPSPAPPPAAAQVRAGGGGKSSSGFSLDLDGDGALLLILFALLVIAICGVGAYLIYQAPAILSEAAFHAVLVPGLVRTARNSHDPGWMPVVFRATVVPFVVVLVLAGVFGYEAHKRCPLATNVHQVFSRCIFP